MYTPLSLWWLVGLWEKLVCLVRGHDPQYGRRLAWCARCGRYL